MCICKYERMYRCVHEVGAGMLLLKHRQHQDVAKRRDHKIKRKKGTNKFVSFC